MEMNTMKQIRVAEVLNELYDRLGAALNTLEDLMNDYAMHRRATMQVRKLAQRCMKDTNVLCNRFYAMVKQNKVDEDWCIVKKFNHRYQTYVNRCIYFE